MIRPLLSLFEPFSRLHDCYGGMASIIALHRVGEADPFKLAVNEKLKNQTSCT